MNSKMWTVARTEFLKYVRKKSFWFAILALPVMLTVINLLSGSDDSSSARSIPGLGDPAQISKDLRDGKVQLGFVDQSGLVPTIPSSFPSTTASLYRQYPDEATAKAALANGEVPAIYVIPADYIQKGELISYSDAVNPFGSSIRESLMETLLATSLYDSKNPMYAFATLNPTANLKVEDLAGAKPGAELISEQQRQATALTLGNTFAFLLYISIFLSASWLLQALIEEKENRVMEVVLSSITPKELLRGKTLGLGLLGLMQMLIWVGIALIARTNNLALSAADGITIPAMTWVLAIVCFLLGYLIYGSMMAGIGAIANTVRESSQLTVVVVIPIIIPLMFLSIIVTQPNGTLATVLSFIPFTAPLVLVIRSVMTSVPLWEIALSLAIMVATVWLFQTLAARMFRANTLLSGAKPSFGRLVQALRG